MDTETNILTIRRRLSTKQTMERIHAQRFVQMRGSEQEVASTLNFDSNATIETNDTEHRHLRQHSVHAHASVHTMQCSCPNHTSLRFPGFTYLDNFSPSCCNSIPGAQDLARTFPNSLMWTLKCLSRQNPFTATSLSMSHPSNMDAGTAFRIPCSRNRFATIIATDPETLSETSANCAEPHVAYCK